MPSESEGYAIFVGKTTDDEENQTIAIAGYDESGLLYGCMHFISEYCNDIIYKQKYIWNEICYKNQLENISKSGTIEFLVKNTMYSLHYVRHFINKLHDFE